MFSRFLSLFHRCGPALLLISALSVYCAAQQPQSVIQSELQVRDPLASAWALGDLDGDHETDVAISREVAQRDSSYLYRVELKLSQGEGGSFTFANTDALGVNITAVDVDGDHDLDLVINGRFLRQRIDVWINDGKGGFSQNLHNLYSAPEDRAWHSLRFDPPKQAINENVLRRVPVSLPYSQFTRP